MLKEQLLVVLNKVWPMLFVFTVIISSIRITYLKVNREKFVFYKEFFSLLFMLYIMILFYVVTYQDPISNTISSYNLVPFKEMFRYPFGSTLFYKNFVGNLLIFVPFGLFIPYYLKTARFRIIFMLTLISSLAIESAQRLIIGRVFDVDDIILNIFGGTIGFLIFIIIEAIRNHLPKMFKKDWFMNILTFILIIIVVAYIYNLDIKIMRVLS